MKGSCRRGGRRILSTAAVTVPGRSARFPDAARGVRPPLVRCWLGSSPPKGALCCLCPRPGRKGLARSECQGARHPERGALEPHRGAGWPADLSARQEKEALSLPARPAPHPVYSKPCGGRASGAATEAPRRGEPPPGSGVAPGDRAPERRRRRGGEGAARDGSCLARRARSSPELWLARRCVWSGDTAAAAARPTEMGTEAGEGITFSVPPFASSAFSTFPEGSSCRRGGAATVAVGEPSQLPPPPPGSFWNVESAAAPGTSGCPAATSGSNATRGRGNSGSGGGRRTTVAYVINEASQGQLVVAESEALQSLREACEAVGATLETLHFGKLDFGETTVLDRFYNAGECVVSSLPSG